MVHRTLGVGIGTTTGGSPLGVSSTYTEPSPLSIGRGVGLGVIGLSGTGGVTTGLGVGIGTGATVGTGVACVMTGSVIGAGVGTGEASGVASICCTGVG